MLSQRGSSANSSVFLNIFDESNLILLNRVDAVRKMDSPATPVQDDRGTILVRFAAGTTSTVLMPDRQDFRQTAEAYHTIPPVTDYPIQALNPALDRPNPLVFLELRGQLVGIGKIVIQLFADAVPKTAENFRSLCCGDNREGLCYKVKSAFGLKMCACGA